MAKWWIGSLTALALSVLSAPALAEPGALVIHDTGCGVLASDGSLLMPLEFQVVVTPGEQLTIRCQTQQPAAIPAPSQTVIYTAQTTGRLCHSPYGASENWTQVITPSGEITFSCRINPSGQ